MLLVPSLCLFFLQRMYGIFYNEYDAVVILKPSRSSGSRGIAKIEKNVTKERFFMLYDVAFNESEKIGID